MLIAIYLTEFSTPRTAYPIRLALDLLNGLPSIVIGVFVYGLLVLGSGQKGYAASIALAIIMVPLIARATQEVLRLVPQSQRDAAHALGMSKWRTTLGVVLPACISGIITGTVLAVARAAGETAPLLLLSSLYDPGTTRVTVERLRRRRCRTSRSRSSTTPRPARRPPTSARGAPRSCWLQSS